MDANTVVNNLTIVCMLCDRTPRKDIIMAEDGFFYHRACMRFHIERIEAENGCSDIIISPVTKEKIGTTLITPKTITSLIGKLSDIETSDDDRSKGVSSCKNAARLNEGDLLAKQGYNTFFGLHDVTKNQRLGFELLVEAASENGSGEW